ncbi:winged helix-turn-helix transcriptional regulator [Streptomyces sp. NBC_00820]|uniref:winged helix-turn-helix transcriptional regulator n=1 Tax=Streptomyces sp. NBC_00820 TaxID=2975842 RepID=UPI002ED4CF21|nr:winged helix-turn-helix transcriptional regulator [Streptomyces sp. NBC_00820]
MSTTAQLSTASIGRVDAQRVQDALSLMSPKWTTWVAQTLAQQRRPMRVREVAAQLPFLTEQFVGKRLATMRADGLVIRAENSLGAPYQLSAFGASMSPVHRALSDWSRAHLSVGTVAGAERVEDAVRRLHLRHTTAMIQILDSGGPTRFVSIAEEAGLDYGHTRQRLMRLQADGLVTRTGPRHGDPYVLTDAGRALGPVYAAVERWSNPSIAQKLSPPRPSVAAASITRSGVPLKSDGIRTAAALRRSTAAPSALFSHAPQPQPRVPTAVTAQSAPTRGR